MAMLVQGATSYENTGPPFTCFAFQKGSPEGKRHSHKTEGEKKSENSHHHASHCQDLKHPSTHMVCSSVVSLLDGDLLKTDSAALKDSKGV